MASCCPSTRIRRSSPYWARLMEGRPDHLRVSEPSGSYSDACRNGHSLGKRAGEVGHTVSITEMPQHMHTMVGSSAGPSQFQIVELQGESIGRLYIHRNHRLIFP